MANLNLECTYARDLEGCSIPCRPTVVPDPRTLVINHALADEMGLDGSLLTPEWVAAVFSGNRLLEGTEPVAQAYAGHQFGGFSPQLGDGRALLLGEFIDRAGRRRDIALKGSGRTPFSRGGDGKATIGPMLREALVSEAMHALGVPTTRSLAVVATGEEVRRDRLLPGAVLTRVAASHIRVGTFEYFAARRDVQRVRHLAEYAIARHDPDLVGRPGRYVAFLENVAARQAALIARWMNVGFIHGVMNTDNVAISGETIDYGPCAFLESYDPDTVFSSIDRHGRYAFGNQPAIACWNLARFAETLVPLIASDGEDPERAIAQASGIIEAFPAAYQRELINGQRAKLGLRTDEPGDGALAEEWLTLLRSAGADATLSWRLLAGAAAGDELPLRTLLADRVNPDSWLTTWRERCARDDHDEGAPGAQRAERMRRVNPWVIPRNHRVEEAISAAVEHADLGPFDRLLKAVRRPFETVPDHARFAEPGPPEVTACYRTFCGT
ncbi:MAG TPA: YdiU family protein [Planctomycetota bacterium]|nr:YdiU family protein [Planctomycetota bacterium]